MNRQFLRAGALLFVLTLDSGFAYGWGSSSSGGSSSSQTPKCIAANVKLSLTKTDCLNCHPGGDAAQVTRHHQLIGKPPKNLSCLNCHQPAQSGSSDIAFPVIRDCIVCHTSAVHDAVVHCIVYDSCGNCHSGSLPAIHSGASSSGNRYSYHGGSYGGSSSTSGVSTCYLCHTSTNTTVQQTVIKGLAGQTVSCSNCHGR